MKRKIVSIGIMCMLMLTILPAISVLGKVSVTVDEIVVPDDYPTIQEAVDAAGMYGKVRVKPGIYYENILIDEGFLELKGDNHLTTIIDGGGNENVLTISAHGIIIEGFTIQNGSSGISFTSGLSSYIIGNSIIDNDAGIETTSFGHTIYHNNFIGNSEHVNLVPENHLFHDGYPSGGNYWEDYTDIDEKSGSNQDQPGSDGIGDTPYYVLGSEFGKDEYPFIEENGWCDNLAPQTPVCNFNKDDKEITVSAVDPDGDQVKFGVSWNNDGNVNHWTGFYNSGEEAKIDCGEHKGTAGVIAEDEHGAQSGWVSQTPKSKAANLPLLKVLEKSDMPLILSLIYQVLSAFK